MTAHWGETAKRQAKRGVDFALHIERRFRTDGALNMASSLSYTSLLSLVPLLAIGLAVLAAFPAFDGVRTQLQATVFRSFVPQVGEQLQTYVISFVGNAGKLTAAGVVGLAFTAVMLLVTIEVSLNKIFRVATPRTPVSRLLVYWTVLTLGPLLLGASFSLSAWFYAVGDWAARGGLSGVARLTAGVLPSLLLMVAFALLFMTVPNRRVRARDAAIGGIAAGIAFGILRWAFGLYLAQAHAYQSIYGAVAVVPIFLFWMYLCWAVVLFGAELTAALPEWRLARPDFGGALPVRRRLAMAVTVLAALFDEAQRGGNGRSRLDLLDIAGESESAFLAVLTRLCEGNYVVGTEAGRFVLGRDPAMLSLADLVHLLDLGLGAAEAEACIEPWMRNMARHLEDAKRAEAEALDLPLRPILEEANRAARPHRRRQPRAAVGEDSAAQ